MSKSIEAKVVTDGDVFEDSEPGAIMYVSNGDGEISVMAIRCPGCGEKSALPLDDGADEGNPGWCWNGNKEKPTLHPSVHHAVKSCGWHGWLRNGIWRL